MALRWKVHILFAVILLPCIGLTVLKLHHSNELEREQVQWQMETQALEHLGLLLHNRLQTLESLDGKEKKLSPAFKRLGVQLYAQARAENGKWKVRWGAGNQGLRVKAKRLMKQLPFSRLSVQRRSWHRVEYPGGRQGYSYVVPRQSTDVVIYDVYFLRANFFSQLIGQVAGEYGILSSLIGDIAGPGLLSEESLKEKLTDEQQGHVQINGRVASYLYQADLQLYLYKMTQPIVMASSTQSIYYFLALMFAALLIGFFILDFFVQQFMSSIQNLTEGVLHESETPRLYQIKTNSRELDELASAIAFSMHDKEEVSILTESSNSVSEHIEELQEELPAQEVLDEVRPKTITALGHLHKARETLIEEGVDVQAIESDLRDIRRLVDKTDRQSQSAVFNPQMNMIGNGDKSEDSVFSIRKPKRAGEDEQEL